jgi:sugar phosphate isomerase/epimerase
MKTRREFLAIAAGSLLLADAATLFGAEEKTPWKIGICDWDLQASGTMNSFAVAKELGFEGVQVSYQPDGTDSLADKANRSTFLVAAKESGVSIASLAMGLLNGRPLATTPEAEGWVADCIDAMVDMNVHQTLLAFFGVGDMNEQKEHQPLVIEKLKRRAPLAEKNKKILAVES